MSPEEKALMQALARVINVVPRALDADLRRDQDLPLTEYFALAYLAETDGHRARMNELAARLWMTISGATRTVIRLEQLGFVARERSATDGRGADVVLTDKGLERLRRAWPSHLQSARRRVLDHLDEDEVRILTRALGSIGSNVDDAEVC
ncbi:MarR family transcriptional regulator [Microbacterium awajiense]|uniref:MarR family transcriptional regulator n=1 Tax=Microbacterium awajiense TaxID=415214 RepID=A0ABP7AWE0_9MICO